MRHSPSSDSGPLARLAVVALLTLIAWLVPAAAPRAEALSANIVISQVYGGGGNSGATYTHDFVELFNRGTTAISISGWSIQYASSTGTSWSKTDLAGTLQPGQYYLIQQAQGSGGTTPLPAPDAAGTIAMSATAGKVVLLNTNTLIPGGTSCPSGAAVVDLVGFGTTTNCSEESPTPNLSNTTAALRLNGGCTESDSNLADFAIASPQPRNTASPPAPCATATSPTGVGAASPDPVVAGASTLLTVAVTPGANPTSTGLAVTADLTAIGGGTAQVFFDDGTNGDVTPGDLVFSFLAAVPAATTPGGKSLPVTITDAQARAGNATIALTVQPVVTPGADVVISQVYGGGGNSGATYTHDFVELYNRSANPVSLTGWSMQYASAAGTSWQVTTLAGMLQPGQYYLIQQAQGAGGTTPLPTPDAAGTIAMSATAGKVALVNGTAALSGSCPTGSPIVDFVGYGSTANCFEGAGPTATLSNTTAALRAGNGATDTNNNNADFSAGAPNPRNSSFGFDAAPEVASTSPANNDANVPVGANIMVTFSEPVNVAGAWYAINCATSGLVSAAVSGGPTIFTLDPDVDFAGGESCSVTVLAAQVTDQDTQDPPDNMAADFTWSFTTAGVDVCTLAYTPAYAIQGSGPAAAITGPVTTQGVVIGDYEGPAPTLRGFYLQDLAGDGDATTSDAIFVFNGNNDAVNLGDVVRVSGSAGEFQDQTQITSVTAIVPCGTASVAPVDVTLPVPSATYLERFEGMLVRFPQTLYVTEHFQLGRFGQVVMSADARLAQPTNVVAPGAPALALQAANNLNRIIVDDELNNQNPDPIRFGRGGNPLSAANTLRGGDTATGMVGVLTYTWAGNAASGNAYRLRPVGALGGALPQFVAANPRPTSPTPVGGTLRVSALNLLNFFNTFDGLPDLVDNCTNGVGGTPADCRGADTQAEFDRQWPKTVAAILAIDADVLGVNEIENDGYGPTSAIAFLVDQLNAATSPGTYAFVDFDAATGQLNALGTDAIKVGLIYKPASVTPVGTTAALNSTAFVNGGDPAPRNRATFAQAFAENSNGARFIISVNHLKSKGSACSAPDAGDGQGNCNVVRTNAANTLAAWLASDPTGTGDSDILIIGDLNAYAREDPITALANSGFTNLISTFLGQDAYSYVFDGQWGYLDHAMASATLSGQVTGVAEYHINADEPGVLDYNTDFKSPGQIISLYAPDPFRVSDHDPVILGLNLNAPPTVSAGGPYSVAEGGSVALSASGADPDGSALSYAWDLDNDGVFETPGQVVTFSAAALDGPSTRAVAVRATDPGGLSATDATTVGVANIAPTVAAPLVTPSPSLLGAPVAAGAAFTDPAPNDAPFTCTVDYGDGSGPQAGVVSGQACEGPTHAYAAVGAYTVTVSVTDKDGGVGFATAQHAVVFNFAGFFQPVQNPPYVNTIKAGSSVPLKFSLDGDQGLNIIMATYPRSMRVSCGVDDPVNEIDDTETMTPGSSGLQYDPATGQYTYVWKTEKLWKNTCRQFTLKLIDGTVWTATFRLN